MKKKYMMYLSSEKGSSFSTKIAMTPEEAEIVKRVLDELDTKKNSVVDDNCPFFPYSTVSCWIDVPEEKQKSGK